MWKTAITTTVIFVESRSEFEVLSVKLHIVCHTSVTFTVVPVTTAVNSNKSKTSFVYVENFSESRLLSLFVDMVSFLPEY